MWTWLSEHIAYVLTPSVIAALVAFLRWGNPRRLYRFVADVGDRETLLKNANDWMKKAQDAEKETAYQRMWGERWMAMARRCQEELDRCSAPRDGGNS